MQDSYIVYGAVAAFVMLAIISPLLFVRYRRATEKLMKSSYMMQSRVYKAVAEKYGAEPNLIADCLTPEGDEIVSAMTRCDRCGSVDECRHFFEQPGGNVDETKEFCPNTDLFIEMAEKLRQEAKC